MKPGMNFEELLDYTEAETHQWQKWLERHPETLAVSAGIAGEEDVAGLVVHIFAAELRYAERLLGLPITPYEELQRGDLSRVFSIGSDARGKLRQFLKNANKKQMEETLSFETRTAGTLTASRRKIVMHTLMHGVRHWAQIATALRKAGYKQDWQHDFIFTEIMP